MKSEYKERICRMKPQTGTGLANGKIILAGEHAVVYHEPAIALPIDAVYVKADIVSAKEGQTIQCELLYRRRNRHAYFDGRTNNLRFAKRSKQPLQKK